MRSQGARMTRQDCSLRHHMASRMKYCTLSQACNITDRDQLRKHKSRISISRKSRTHILRPLSHFWAGPLVYITGSHGTMAVPHALMVCHKAKCNGCVASCPYSSWDARWAQLGTAQPDLRPDTSGPARWHISQNVTVSWRWHMESLSAKEWTAGVAGP